MKFTALILAGSRFGQNDEVAKAAGVVCKALAEIDGTPMIERVISALKKSGNINKIIASAPKEVSLNEDILRIDTAKSPVRSILKALEYLEGDTPLLVTTADHALLTPAMINRFIEQYDSANFDVAVAMLPLDIVTQKYPDMRRTRLKFKEGGFKACNLFIFRDKAAAQKLLNFWQEIESQRKKPWKMVRALGGITLLRYITGRLTLESALAHLGRRTGTKPQAVMLDIAEAAIDVDSVGDLEFVRSLVKDGNI